MIKRIASLLEWLHYEANQTCHVLLTGERWKGTIDDWRRLQR